MVKQVTFEGRVYSFPDDATDAEIADALDSHAPRRVGVGEDVARSGVTGVQRGASNMAGLFGDAPGLIEYGASALGVDPDTAHAIVSGAQDMLGRVFPQTRGPTPTTRWATGEEISGAVRDAAPQSARDWIDHTPQTVAGEYAHTIGEFLPGALAPGSAATRVARVVIPGASSETAGHLTEGTPYEAPARLAAGVVGGLVTEAGVAANAARAARRQANPSNAALEQEFGPMTAGERSGNTRQRLEEDDLRRGIGSEQAQRTIQAFDDRRVPEVRRNINNIATRGQEPLSEDLGGAGTAVADSLRSRVDNMRQQQSELYQRAFDAAENERVSANQVANELADRVDNVIGQEFLDAGPARAVIGRLQAQISDGQATYGTVERARQALNRQLSSALKAQDDAQVYAITRIIDEVDSFVAPRLSQDAQRAITEARGFTREMLSQFGQRQRNDLATGHVGRGDPGGRAIERVLNNDMTGEQVVDAILGSGSRPSQQALGAVRRIREINDSIVYTNRNSPSGVRVPGRVKVGGQTQGERRFAADSADSRYGVELPNPELQGLREALFHRILRPLDARNDGGMIPAQTIVTNFRRALDGPGAEITAVMFTENEMGAMRRALAYMEGLVPPAGAAVSGTTPALSRMVQSTFDKLVGIIPGIGPVLREAMENATSTNAARAAVKPPRAGRTPSYGEIEQPTTAGPAAATAASVTSAGQNRRRYSEGRERPY